MRMTIRHAPHPADRIVAAFNLAALAGWIPLLAEPTARRLAAVHALIALAFALFGVLPRRVRRSTRPRPILGPGDPRVERVLAVMRDAYPLLAVCLAWRELGVRHAFLHGAEQNALVAGFDAWLVSPAFGDHANLLWAPAMPALSEAMQAVYFAFLPLAVLLVARLLMMDDAARRREGIVRLTLTFLGCFACYLLLPTDGPRATMPRFTLGIDHGFFFRLNDAVRAAGDSLGTAFPSSHVAGSATLAWIAWRCCGRRMAWVYSLVAALIALAVVYTQNHFVVDALAGIGVTLLLQAIVAPALLHEPEPLARPAALSTPRANAPALAAAGEFLSAL